MANYTAADVKKLRETTGSGMLDCKKALEETGGDQAYCQQQLEEDLLDRFGGQSG